MCEKQRLDKWLFFARIVKSRTLAAALSGGGKVRVNHDKVDKPAFLVKTGDQLTVTLPNRIFICQILALGERRGPASKAQSLYEDLTPKSPTGDEKLLDASIIRGTKPNKKERRKALQIIQRLD